MDITLAEQRRGEILEAALKIFSEKGYHAAKIEDIAGELNLGHGTFYRYFKNKLDIFNHVVEEIVGMITGLVADINPYDADTLEDYRLQLQTIGDRLFGLFKANPSISRVIFYEAFGINDEDLDLYVYHNGLNLTGCTEATPFGCDPNNGQSGTSNEHLEWLIDQNDTYYVVVHGWQGSENLYDICIGLDPADCP